jgi:hypothetical protein
MKSLTIALALARLSEAALRFGCSTLSIQRTDPVVEPGAGASAHLHQIVGGNAFHPNMTGDVSAKATCTTCTFSEDFSNYWTAVMFFKHANGSYKRVPIMSNTGLPGGITGGMTVYYTQVDFQSNGNAKITSFPPGFRMTVGKSGSDTRVSNGLKFVCLADKGTRVPETDTFPTGKCRAGIMTVHHFPQCWDGKNIDSPDHQSHMFNTVVDSAAPPQSFKNAGPCPASHPIRVPRISLETLWDTTSFNNMWPADGKNPFVLSNGDGKGFGTHADYAFGWKGDSLQKAMDSGCNFNACENGRPLKSQAVAPMNACTVTDIVKEDISSWLTSLPGAVA